MKAALGRAARMLAARISYWLRGLRRDNDDVAAGRGDRIDLATGRADFLDQGEDVALVAAQQLLQMLAALRLHRLAQFGELAAGGEGPGNLVVEFHAVGDDEKRPVARLLAQALRAKNSIDKLLPEPWVCQKTPSRPRFSSIFSTAAIALLTPRS